MTRFQMIKINVEQFAIIASEVPDSPVSVSTGIAFMYSTEAHRIACSFDIEYLTDEEKLLKLKTRCEFEIHSEDWNNFIGGNRLKIPKTLLEYFAVHTVGTARGILFCKTEGTPFNNFIIPPIDVASIITEGIDEQIES